MTVVTSKLSSLAAQTPYVSKKDKTRHWKGKSVVICSYKKELRGRKRLPCLNFALPIWKSLGWLVFTHLRYK